MSDGYKVDDIIMFMTPKPKASEKLIQKRFLNKTIL